MASNTTKLFLPPPITTFDGETLFMEDADDVNDDGGGVGSGIGGDDIDDVSVFAVTSYFFFLVSGK